MGIILIILGLILFVGLVVVHEFGHFIAARRNGVVVEEFGIGFPPKAKTLTVKNGTEYTLNWLPLGGFVRLKGEHSAATKPGTFGAATLWAKVKIMLAGVVMNLLTAIVLLTFLALVGIPKLIDNQFTVQSDTKIVRNDVLVGYVAPDSPAESSGILVRDKLLGYKPVDGPVPDGGLVPINSADDLPAITESLAGKSAIFAVSRDGKRQDFTVQLRAQQEVEDSKNTDEPKAYLGVSPTEYTLQRSTWSAPIVAVGLVKQMTQLTLDALGTLISGLLRGDTAKATEQVAGPVGIFVLIKNGSLLGYQFILMLIAVISLTLAIMNALPIPALDGGRLFVTLLFAAFKKPLTQKTEERIHGTGFVVLMILFVLITIVDVRRFL